MACRNPLWAELRGQRPRRVVLPPAETWDTWLAGLLGPTPPVRVRFSVSVGRCLRQPGLTLAQLRAAVEATSEPLPSELDEVVRAAADGPRSVARAIARITTTVVDDDELLGTTDPKRLATLLRAAMLAAGSGLPLAFALRYAAVEGRVLQGGVLLAADDGDDCHHRGRLCEHDVQAWRRHLGLGGWMVDRDDPLQSACRLTYQRRHTVEVPELGVCNRSDRSTTTCGGADQTRQGRAPSARCAGG